MRQRRGRHELGHHGLQLVLERRNDVIVAAQHRLDARFRDHTMKLFEKHGMTNVLYLHPTDAAQGAGTTLVYFLAHASVDAARAAFDAFRADPDWIKVRDASEVAGKILAISPPSSLFLEPTDFSMLK